MAANTGRTSNMAIDILLWALVDDLLAVPMNERIDHNTQFVISFVTFALRH